MKHKTVGLVSYLLLRFSDKNFTTYRSPTDELKRSTAHQPFHHSNESILIPKTSEKRQYIIVVVPY